VLIVDISIGKATINCNHFRPIASNINQLVILFVVIDALTSANVLIEENDLVLHVCVRMSWQYSAVYSQLVEEGCKDEIQPLHAFQIYSLSFTDGVRVFENIRMYRPIT